MSARYVAVNWNRQKRIYDLVIGLGAPALVALFVAVTLVRHPTATIETGLIRGLGLTALVLVHVILCIGPLCRLSPAFLPLLYNRRHLGVLTCLLGLAHAGFVVFQYHALGDLNPLLSVLVANQAFNSLAGFPFELLGFGALVILVVMAATSHDFWLSVLSPPVWKSLHMLLYVAYALLIGHVALGPLQAESGLIGALALGLGAATVLGLHLVAAWRELGPDSGRGPAADWVPVGAAAGIPEGRAIVALVGRERVAVFRHEGRLSAVSNVCKHQNGPLGEGRIVDGCITCPWHGYQYRPESGSSPPPFDDRIATYDLRVEAGQVLVRNAPHPPGTRVEPVAAEPAEEARPAPPFYVGYLDRAPAQLARRTAKAVAGIGGLAMLVVGGLAATQEPFAAARFEFGQPREWEGRIVTTPYPRLLVASGSGVTQYLLAAAGKRGADSLAAGWNERLVRLRGTLAERGTARLIELAERPEAGSAGPAPPPRQELGVHTLRGEIVDGKCWTGVMNPGEGKTHLGCAVRCLSGGLPPLLALRDGAGRERHLVLSRADGGPLPRSAIAHAGRPVTVTGRVVREADLLFLRVNPDAIQVLAK